MIARAKTQAIKNDPGSTVQITAWTTPVVAGIITASANLLKVSLGLITLAALFC